MTTLLDITRHLVGCNTISIKNVFDSNRELQELLRQLTSQSDSLSPETRGLLAKYDRNTGLVKATDYIAAYCRNSGFQVDIYSYNNQSAWNIVATKGDPNVRPALALSGHIDTMGFDEKWKHEPFSMEFIDNRYYGLGIVDMTLFVATMLKLGEMVAAKDLDQPFALYFTSNEEVGCIGAKQLVKDLGKNIAENIIVGEPTEFWPRRIHKGYIYFKVIIKGKDTGHSSGKSFSNAIEIALPVVIDKLQGFKSRLELIRGDYFDPPYATMNLGKFVQPSDAAKNKTAYYVELHGDIRPIIGQNNDQVFALLEGVIAQANEVIGALSHSEITVKVQLERMHTPAMSTPEDTNVFQAAIEIATKVEFANREKPAPAVPFNAEGGLYNQAGANTIIWGPGSIKQAHKPDEFVHMKWFDPKYIDAYLAMISQFCSKGGSL